jgi:hypothetical protein
VFCSSVTDYPVLEKFVEMTIDRGQSVGMIDIDGLPITEGLTVILAIYPSAAAYTACLPFDLYVHLIPCANDLNAIAEVGNNARFVINRPPEIIFRINERLGVDLY